MPSAIFFGVNFSGIKIFADNAVKTRKKRSFKKLVNSFLQSTIQLRHYRGPKKPKAVLLGHFLLSEKNTYLRIQIINQVFWSFWGVNQLSTTSSL